jgi:hypothetical protein
MRKIDPSHFHITMNGPLLDHYLCAALVQASDQIARLPNATEEEAIKLSEILVGAYPKRDVNDPIIYARAIKSAFLEFSTEIGKEAIDRMTRSLKFLPTRADLFEVLGIVKTQSQICGSVGRVHLTEHARRDAVAKRDATLAAEREARNNDPENPEPDGQAADPDEGKPTE